MLNTSNDQRKLLPNFDQLFAATAQAPGGVARLRELILTLAVQGKLVAQDANDEPASELLKKIRAEKDRLLAEGKIKKDKPLAEIAEEEKSFELPAGWQWGRFGEISINRDGERIPVASSDREKKEKIYDYYGASGVIDKIDKYLFDKKLLLIGEDGANLINRSTPIAFLAHGKYWVNNHAHVIDAIQSELLDYYCLFINAISLEPYVTGTAQPKMNQAKLNSIVVPLPPLAEQSRIVARVEALMRLCDALEEKGRLEHTQHQQLLQALLDSLTQTTNAQELARNWERLAKHFDLLIDRPEAVDALEQTILQLAVRGLLVEQDASEKPASELLKKVRSEKDRLIAEGKIKKEKPLSEISEEKKPFELPIGWHTERLGNLLNISGGITLGRKTALNKPIEIPYLRVANVQRWMLELNSMKSVMIDESEIDRYKLVKDDLLITEGGDWDKVGRTAIWSDELPVCAHQNHVFKARKIIPEWNVVWSEIFLNSDIARKYFASSAKQTTNLASINMTQLKNCLFPIPPLPEQSRIVVRVTELRALCQQLREKLTQARHTQTQLAQAWVEQAAA